MISRVDARLRDEIERFALRFACEDCAAFDERSGACAYGYPTEPHRRDRLDEAPEIAFCKAFEVA